ncbi:MAG: porphobilinogen synthase [Methanophagales archaeon]|nr:porphobilinogen synthase [Methanophagales archaeon]MCW3141799.1 porphobilinogen synthase [Methanophagales archaeon]
MFPAVRMRRLRSLKLIRETQLSIDDFILPVFIDDSLKGETKKTIGSMPGQYRFSIDSAVKEVAEARSLGIKSVLLFGIPRKKDETGSEAFNTEGVIQRAVRRLKKEADSIVIITDLCLCEYTTHGHCGLVDPENGRILNDPTLKVLGKIAVSQAKAGADIVAPSGMMDGMVKAIRENLDEEGLTDTAIMSYSAKYNSALYGPFREAADSGYQFGDRSSYQMDISNAREALREVELDIREGADIVMVKPAIFYLDIISKVRERFDVPLAAYSVSGEYSMLTASSEKGYLNREEVMMEGLTAIKRAGADLIITYFAKEVAKLLR